MEFKNDIPTQEDLDFIVDDGYIDMMRIQHMSLKTTTPRQMMINTLFQVRSLKN